MMVTKSGTSSGWVVCRVFLWSNPARGLDAVHRPARERRTAAGLGQGVAGDGSGGGRRARRSPPHEPGASRAEGNPARVSDFAAVQQRLHAFAFILGWKVLGYARRFAAEIVNYADDFAVLGKSPAAEMRSTVEGLMKRLKLPINAEKTRCCRVPEEPMTFLGYRIGRNYRQDTGRAYIGTRPEPGERPEHLPSREQADRVRATGSCRRRR